MSGEAQPEQGLDTRHLPRIISVDDHVVEPPDLWISRLPTGYHDRAPRVIRERGHIGATNERSWTPDPDGQLADVWYYEDDRAPLTVAYAGAGVDVGEDRLARRVTTYDDIRPGCWRQADRLADMDRDHTEVSACFPNFFTRFCGQTFLAHADRDLALRCLRAYNDWVVDDWCGGDARRRLVPITIVPLWDTDLAADEVRRCAGLGSHAVSFPDMPAYLGLPSWYSADWDPFFAACSDTATTVAMHTGSTAPAITSGDAPFAVLRALAAQNGMYSLIDCIWSGLFDRFPDLKLMYSEANVGWMPYTLQRMDLVWTDEDGSGRARPRRPPSEYVADRVYGCIVDDVIGLQQRDLIGIRQICYETDYPHGASFWPDNRREALRLAARAGLDDAELYEFVRGTAIRALQLEHFGITR